MTWTSEVVSNFQDYFFEYLDLPKHPAINWEDERVRDNIHKIAYKDHFWMNIPPLIKATDIDFEISGYCTHRLCDDHITESWLKLWQFPDKEIININGKGLTKGQALKGICDIFIDDAIHNFEDVRNNEIECYLMDCSHNQYYETPFRVKSVREFGDIINGRTNRLFQGRQDKPIKTKKSVEAS